MLKKSPSAPTLEYTCSVCTCGRELSTFFYLITTRKEFEAFAQEQNLQGRNITNIGFTTLDNVIERYNINFCCLMNLRYGIRVPISVIESSTERDKVSSHKYPEGLPGPLSHEKTLTWL